MGFFEEVDRKTSIIQTNSDDIHIKNNSLSNPEYNKKYVETNFFNGIKNTGSSCFLNCIIQLFYHIRLIRENLIVNQTNPPQINFFSELNLIFNELKNSKTSANAISLIESFGEEKDWFNYQQDANECYIKVFLIFFYKKYIEFFFILSLWISLRNLVPILIN